MLRDTVDALLNKLRPAEASDGAVSTFVAEGASGYKGVTDEEELATVDVLDGDADTGELDKPTGRLAVNSDALDKTGVTGDIIHLKSLPNLVTIELNITDVTGDEEAFREYRWLRAEKNCALFLSSKL